MEKEKKVEYLQQITKMCLKKEEVEALEGISSDVEFLISESLQHLRNQRYGESVEALQIVLDITWEELNTGHWSLVPDCQRMIYSVASLLKVVSLVQQALLSSDETSTSLIEEAVKAADMGLLLGNSHREQLTQAARLMSEAIGKCEPKISISYSSPIINLGHSDVSIVSKSAHEGTSPQIQVSTVSIPSLHCPSLETFSAQHFYPRKPVKITGCMNHWKALRNWNNLDYLLAVAGSRTVPVELGSSYAQADWSQRLMTLQDFITRHITNPSYSTDGIGYLAQHQLFDQVPELRKDIVIPDYCACSDEEGEGEAADINAWFGPAGTVSPLHYDPKHNLLCQVVGRKQVVLYSPSDSDGLYPHEGRLLSNTARVDPEAPDYKLYPKFRDTQAYMCTLSPGEMVYIPPSWWHHIRATDLSFSVSFWWT